MWVRYLLLTPLAVLILIIGAAFFVVRNEMTENKTQQLTLGKIGEPDTLNPIVSESTAAGEVEGFIFNALLSADENLNITCGLAKSYRMTQKSTAFYASKKQAESALTKLQNAKDQWAKIKLVSCKLDGNKLILQLAAPSKLVTAGTGYEKELFKIISQKEMLPVSVLTIAHDPTKKLASGELCTSEVLKQKLTALAGLAKGIQTQDIFPVNDSILSVTVIGNQEAFRKMIPKALAGENAEPPGKIMEIFDQALLNEPKIVFKLREDVRWQDGEKFTSADAEFTYRSTVDPKYRSPRASNYWLVKDVEAPTPYSFIVNYRVPYTDCLITWGQMSITPSHILKGKSPTWWADNYNSKPIGTGPYRLVEWRRNEFVRLEANPDYYEGKPHIKTVVFRVMPDSFTNEITFQEGGFDTQRLMFHQIKRYKSEPNRFKIFQRWARGYLYIGWNQKKFCFKDTKVRQALAHAVNVDRIIEYVYFGWARRSTGPIPNVYWYSNNNIDPYPFDPKKAKQMLAEAGWKDTDGDGWLDKNGERFEFSLITNNGNAMRALIQVLVKEDLKKVGIKVDTSVYEWAVFINNYLKPRHFDAVVLGWYTPQTFDRYQLWHSSQIPEPGLNFCEYNNPEIDRLTEKLRTTFERDEIEKLSHKIEEIIYRDQPYLFLLEGKQGCALYRGKYVVRRPTPDGKWITEPIRNTQGGYDGYDFYMPWWAPAKIAPQLEP
ncbi:MAG: hypothetical protein KAR11_08225 [Phycisphaerae bacterium]|nr:hypothetical protein [Phycisphaerae bacterium]